LSPAFTGAQALGLDLFQRIFPLPRQGDICLAQAT
jgi:hypothetical protein